MRKAGDRNSMKHVFEAAAKVCVYLGATAAISDFAMDRLCKVARQVRESKLAVLFSKPVYHIEITLHHTPNHGVAVT